MAWSSIVDERYAGGSFSLSADAYDAPHYTNSSYRLSQGSYAYGNLTDAYTSADEDVYSLGSLSTGYYTLDVDDSTWDFGNIDYGNLFKFSLLNSYGGVVESSYFSDIDFTVETSSTYYVKIEGPTYREAQYRVKYEKTGELPATNTVSIWSNFSYTGSLDPGSTVDGIISVYDANGNSDGLVDTYWAVDGVSQGKSETLTLDSEDVGKPISVLFALTDDDGYFEMSSVYTLGTVTAPNSAPSITSTPSSSVNEDSAYTYSMSATDSDVGDSIYTDPANFALPSWLSLSGTTISGTPSNSDVGTHNVTVAIKDDNGGTDTQSFTITVVNTNDAPSITSTPSSSVNEDSAYTYSMSATDSDVGDSIYTDPANFALPSWLSLSGTTISGTPSNSDVGTHNVTVAIKDDNGGTDTQSFTVTVVNTNDSPTGSASISGTAAEGETLTAVTSSIADADGLGSFSYQWLRDGSAISGATNSTYALTSDDVGAAVSVRVSYTDAQGTAEALTSSATSSVQNANDSPTGSASISGTAAEGEALTAVTSSIADADGLGSFSYQWLRDGSAISGATNLTYSLTNSDVGTAVSVRISYTDAQGTAESLTSSATSTVQNVNDSPTGSASITGTATQGQTLTAVTSSIADADGLGSFSYQWLRDGSAISGATNSTYSLTNSDVGTAVSVRVSYTDAQGTAETLTSSATSSVQNVNDSPTGSASISGTAAEGEALTAVTSSIADTDGLGSFSYQWLRDGSAISGATNSTYALTSGDIGAAVSVRVSYTDAQGTAETLTSSATSSVQNANDSPTGSASISGTAAEGETLTAVTSSIADADGLGSFSYQWIRDGTDISGATASTYTLAQADVGAAISIRASYTDDGGTAESVTSSATGSIINVNDAPSGSITISGMASEGQVLTVDTSSLTDEDGLGALSYQWFANDETFVSSSPVELYQRADDELFSYKLIGSANNEDGNGHYAFELTFYKQLDNNIVEKSEAPFEITAPFSNSFVSAGSFYEVSAGTAYELAPNTSTLTLTQSEVDKAITVKVSYTDAYGTAEELTSSASVAVVNVNDNPVGAVTISGVAAEGEALTAVTSSIADADGLGSFSYQWLRDGSAISGATNLTYSLTNSDVGTAVSVRISYTDAQGTAESLTSSATSTVQNVNDSPTGSASITGTATQGQTLTAVTSSIADADGLGSFSYQWLRDGSAISGATNSTYSLTNSDVGTAVSVRVSYTDAQGTAETLTSSATSSVQNVNDSPTGSASISGTAAEGEALTAVTSSIADADGLGSFSYQWLRDGSAISGATNSTYALTSGDIGAAVSVRVSYTDAQGTAETLTSSATSSVQNVNDSPTGSASISGTAAEGETLTAVTSSIADADGLGAFSYQWRRGDDDISGATNSSYTLTAADIGYEISFHISYTDGSGTTETLVSNSRSVVESLPAVVTETVNLETGLTEKSTAFENTGNEPATAVLFQFDDDESGVVTVKLPASISFSSVGPIEAVDTTSASSVLNSALDKVASLQNSEASSRMETFVSSLPETNTLQIRTLTPASASKEINETLVISGSGNSSSKSVEAFVIDLSQLPSNTSVQLDNIEFAAISGSATLIGGAGSNVISADDAVQNILLGEDDDILDAGGGDDTVGSAGGDDEVYGGEGNDIVFGGSGNDVVDGGSGDDEVRGDEGDDTLTGGSGSDTFVFRPGFGNDVVTDFNKTEDSLIFYDAAGELIESSQLNETQNSDGNAVLTAADGSSVTLQGVARYSPILEDLGAISVVNTGSGSNMVLEFYADDSLVGASVTSFDAVVTFDTSKATYVSAEIDAAKYLGFPSETAGVINLSGISLTGGSSADPLFTISLTDLNTSQDLAVLVSGVLVNGTSLEGSTLLIGGPDTVDVTAAVISRSGASLSDVALSFDDGSDVITVNTNESGLSTASITSGTDVFISGSFDYVSSSKSINSQDALDALRLAVGMDTQNGSSTAFDYIAADFNQDGKVTSSDALEILKYAVGLPTTEQAEWVFVDTNGDYSGISKSNTSYTEGVTIADLSADTTIGLTGILIGDVNDSYSGLIA